MIRKYEQKKVIANYFIEKIAFVLLLPLLGIQRSKSSSVQNILLVEPFQMGDILSLTPLIDPLQKKYSGCKIFLFTKATSGQVLEFDSRIHALCTSDFPWSDHGKKKFSFKRYYAAFNTAWRLRKYNFDLGIDTRGDIRSQILLVLAGCQKRIGYTNYLHSNITVSGHLLTHAKSSSQYTHRYEWNVDLLTSIGFTQQELLPIKFPCFVPDKLSLPKATTKSVVIHLGGGWIFRRWNEAKWVQLIEFLQKKNYDLICVIGGPSEMEILTNIEKRISEIRNVVIRTTSLKEMILLIEQSVQFICLDSGPMNLAACLNKNVVALFGPGEPAKWRPLNPNGRFVQRVSKFPCSPCLQLQCLFPTKNCMQEISLEDVVAELSII